MSNQIPPTATALPTNLTPSMFQPGKVRFFWMGTNYNNYLRSIDDKVRLNTKNGNNRPSVAVGLVLNGHNYIIPLTSQHDPQWNNQLTVKIKEEETLNGVTTEKVISCLKINNMHPAIESELTYIDFEEQSDNYKRLLYKEYDYLKKNLEEVTSKATKLHSKLTSGKARHFKPYCCDFAKLEETYKQYNPLTTYPPVQVRF
ncbi:protein AbiQ [Evansella vedderi]|uniref:Protein AbiQ n=1 Tax=Evansella vedderi TaxID=38282 RepID=A0ABT9ZRU3_9BACI|nr:type III toxin-antitoxin system ToxN/AbiQ family toxin [Evansella vedderi]MDQ0253924.1 protein AbiQ [Evansella vedderi]